MTASNIFEKDPQAALDYTFDWKAATNGTSGADGDWLEASETITTRTIAISPTGLTKVSDALSDSNTSVTVWLSGGSPGIDYTVSCKIITSLARTDERSITVKVVNR